LPSFISQYFFTSFSVKTVYSVFREINRDVQFFVIIIQFLFNLLEVILLTTVSYSLDNWLRYKYVIITSGQTPTIENCEAKQYFLLLEKYAKYPKNVG